QALRQPVRRPLLPKLADTTTRQVVRVFLCHSKVDKPRVRELYARLKTEDFVQPSLDEKDLLPGQEWERVIAKTVRESHCVLVCLSKQSSNRAGYVHKE